MKLVAEFRHQIAFSDKILDRSEVMELRRLETSRVVQDESTVLFGCDLLLNVRQPGCKMSYSLERRQLVTGCE